MRTPEQVDLQALHRNRDWLVSERTALMNQARAFYIEHGLALRTGAGGFHADIRRHLGNLVDIENPGGTHWKRDPNTARLSVPWPTR